MTNSCLIQSLSDIFDPEEFPPQSSKHLATCKECGQEYDTHYNKLTSANLCRQEHSVERTSKDVRGTGWECSECGQVWVHDCDYCIDADDLSYCYEGLHEANDKGTHSEDSNLNAED